MYDLDLADRIRAVLATEPNIDERNLFGGLAFFAGDHMAVAASGRGGLMVRTDPAQSEGLVASSNAEPMVMGGREMPGWLRVPTTDLASARALTKWVRLGLDFARTLPPKPPPKPRRG